MSRAQKFLRGGKPRQARTHDDHFFPTANAFKLFRDSALDNPHIIAYRMTGMHVASDD